MLFPGSRVSLEPGALRSTSEYDGARANVLDYDQEKQRYALELIHPDFAGKRLLCREEALDFHFALLEENLREAFAVLRRGRGLSFKDCDTFEQPASSQRSFLNGGDERSRLGKALVADRSFDEEAVIFVDRPFLVVSNPEGLERWVRRWDSYYEMVKRKQVGDEELIDAFEAMDFGGDEVVATLMPDARETLRLLWASSGRSMTVLPEQMRQQEEKRVAMGFARWQTNQHEFPPFRDQQRRALYWLAPKVAHSCEPNVGWEDPDAVDGRVELRALRRIAPGDVLGVNYMDPGFLLEPVQERRQRLLKERKFHCVCGRCLRELRQGLKSAPAPKAERPPSMPEVVAKKQPPAGPGASGPAASPPKKEDPPAAQSLQPAAGLSSDQAALDTALRLLRALLPELKAKSPARTALEEFFRPDVDSGLVSKPTDWSAMCSELQGLLERTGRQPPPVHALCSLD